MDQVKCLKPELIIVGETKEMVQRPQTKPNAAATTDEQVKTDEYNPMSQQMLKINQMSCHKQVTLMVKKPQRWECCQCLLGSWYWSC